MKKRVFSMLLALIMALSLLPTVALAEEPEPHTHCVCGDINCRQDTDGHEKDPFTNVISDGFDGSAMESGKYYLAEDVTLSEDIIIDEGTTVDICLNGHVLRGTGTGNVIYINEGGTLNLLDCQNTAHKFRISNEEDKAGLWVLDEENGTETVTGGVITGGNTPYGGCVYNEGTFMMSGGNLVGNKATHGGGVHNGGEGSVAKFIMQNGKIVGNLASGSESNAAGGGGVYNIRATFEMKDGEISNNIASSEWSFGGGVFNYYNGTFTMSGGSITKNSVSGEYSYGGGVENEGTFTMSGGKITENTASGTDCVVGGVYNWGDFILTNEVEISGNYAVDGQNRRNSNVGICHDVYVDKDEDTENWVIEEDFYALTIGEDFDIVGSTVIGIDVFEEVSCDYEIDESILPALLPALVVVGEDEAPITNDVVSKFVADNAEEFKVELESGKIWLTDKTESSGGGYSDDDYFDDVYIPPTPTITVPVSSDSTQVQAQATVNGSEATVKKPDGAKLEALLENATSGGVEIDLSGLNQKIESVKLPTETLNQIAKANEQHDPNAEALSVKLSTGEISFDAAALNAVADQTDGTELKLVLDDAGTQNLNAAQKQAVKDLDVRGVIDAYLVNVKTKERISDFKGGVATLSVPFTIPEGTRSFGFSVWYVDDNGVMTKHVTRYENGKLIWRTGHLSDYVIVYDAKAMLNPFVDVPADSYYYDAVLWAAAQGITSGTDSTHFSPDWDTTRAQMVTFNWLALGSPEPKSTSCEFTDLDPDAYYYKAVLWAAENGYALGTSKTTFCPDVTVTRCQIVTFLWRIAGKLMDIEENPFNDIAEGRYYFDAVKWASENGLTEGTSETTFSPDDNCTRAQIVTFLYRYFVK